MIGSFVRFPSLGAWVSQKLRTASHEDYVRRGFCFQNHVFMHITQVVLYRVYPETTIFAEEKPWIRLAGFSSDYFNCF